MGRSRNFGCDRPSKDDFTASTKAYMIEQGADRDIDFYELTSAGTFVRYGSMDAYEQAPIDIVLIYDRKVIFYFELKDRWEYYSFSKCIVEEGSFINPGVKMDNVSLIPQGKIKFKIDFKEVIYDIPAGVPAWTELYKDNVIRTWWDLTKVIDDVKMGKWDIEKIHIDKDSPRVSQDRGTLPVSAATEYNRIRQWDYDQYANY